MHHSDAQAKVLVESPTAAKWWTWKQPGVGAVFQQERHANETPAKYGRRTNGELHGYSAEQRPCPNPIRNVSWRGQQPPTADASSHTNTIVLPSMRAASPSGSPSFQRGSSGKLAGSGLLPGSSAPLRTLPGTERATFEEWMAAQRAPTTMEMQHNRQSFVDRIYHEAQAKEAAEIVAMLSPQRSPRMARAPRVEDVEASSPSTLVHSARKYDPDAYQTDRSGTRTDRAAHFGHTEIYPPAGPNAYRRGRTDVMNPYSLHHAGGSVAGAMKDYGAAKADTSFAFDRHNQSLHELQDSGAPSLSPPWARGRSDLQYNQAPRHQRAEYEQKERLARESADGCFFRRAQTGVTVPGYEDRPAIQAIQSENAKANAALRSSDIHRGMDAREYRMVSRPQ